MTTKKYFYEFPRPSLTVDGIILAKEGEEFKVLLIQRKRYPFENSWALPGGFVDEYESVEDAVKREILEETGLAELNFKQLKTFSKKGRDPRGWTVSVVFWTITELGKLNPKAADDAKSLAWFAIDELPSLAFDHKEIMDYCLRDKLVKQEMVK